MGRIDAALATQMGDVNRPNQSARDVQLQAAAARAITPEPTRPVSADDLRAAAAAVKAVVEKASGRRLNFKVDDSTGELCVVVRDDSTGEVISQIPSEEMLRVRANIDQMVGVILDKLA